jgi:hypothetical protein
MKINKENYHDRIETDKSARDPSHPDQVQHGLTTYDAKDPDTKFPPIRELRPPAGRRTS